MKAVDLVNDVKAKSGEYNAAVIAANAAIIAENTAKDAENAAVLKLAAELKANGPIVIGSGDALTVYQTSTESSSGFITVAARGENAELPEDAPAPDPVDPPADVPVDEPIDQDPSDVATS